MQDNAFTYLVIICFVSAVAISAFDESGSVLQFVWHFIKRTLVLLFWLLIIAVSFSMLWVSLKFLGH